MIKKYIPETAFLELTNYCNLKCSMCNFHSKDTNGYRHRGFMEVELAKKILSELGSYENNIWVALHGAGEPLLHKNLIDVLEFCFQFKNLNFGFLTNGMLLTEDYIDKILRTGVRWISVSIDGNDKELFEKYRIGSSYELIIENTLKLIEKAKNTQTYISVNMTMQDEMKYQEKDFVKFWIDKVNTVSISPCKPIGSRSSEYENEIEVQNRKPCFMLYSMLTIYWDGSLGLCCEDWFNDYYIGNLNDDTIENTWNNSRMNLVRQMHEQNDYDELNLCKNCSSWLNKYPIVMEKDNIKITKNSWQTIYEKINND